MDRLIEIIKQHGFDKLFNTLSYEKYFDRMTDKNMPKELMEILNKKDPVMAACLMIFNLETIYMLFQTLLQMYEEHLKALGLNDEEAKKYSEEIITAVLNMTNKNAMKIGLATPTELDKTITIIASCGIFKDTTKNVQLTEAVLKQLFGGEYDENESKNELKSTEAENGGDQIHIS